MITKRDNYMGRHLILALFEEGPILHLNFLAWGPLFLTLSFFLLRARRASLASQGERAPVHVIVEVDLLHISKTVRFRHMLHGRKKNNFCFYGPDLKTLSFRDFQMFCFPIYRYMSSLALRSEASSASSPRFARNKKSF